jgi:hypothetical protein
MYSRADNTVTIEDCLRIPDKPLSLVVKGLYCVLWQMRSGRTKESLYCPFNVRAALVVIRYNFKKALTTHLRCRAATITSLCKSGKMLVS